MDTPDRRRPFDRTAAVRRLSHITRMTAVAGAIGTVAFGGLAAVTYRGASIADAADTAGTSTSLGTTTTAAANTTTATSTTSQASTGQSQTTLSQSATTISSGSSGSGQVSTGGSG